MAALVPEARRLANACVAARLTPARILELGPAERSAIEHAASVEGTVALWSVAVHLVADLVTAG